MNEKTKGHDACDKHCCRGLPAALSTPDHSSIQTWLPLQSHLQPCCTDKPIDEGQEKQSNDSPSPDVFEELFCPGLASDALAPLAPLGLSTHSGPHSDVVKQGYLGKQEQKHKRYFVLRAGSDCGPSRLEWYKTQEKFTAMEKSAGEMMLFGSHKQGMIYLRCCLGVSQISSSRKDYKVALYAKDQTLMFVGKDEQEQHEWYVAIKKLMEEEFKDEGHGEAFDEEDAGYCTLPPAAFFKQVWPVSVKPRGLGRSKALAGETLLCLTASSLVLVRVGTGIDLPSITLPLLAVRRFGHLDGSFFLELGRSAPHGPGEIWMEAREEGNPGLAQQIHEVVRGVVRALRALPDFSWSPTSSQSTNYQSQSLLVLKRSRAKHREKLVNCTLHNSPAPPAPCESLNSQSDFKGQETQKTESVSFTSLSPLRPGSVPESDSYMEMKTDPHSPARVCRMEGWESSEEEGLGYMMMSPQVTPGPLTLHQDEYVIMASPQKHDYSSHSFLQTSFSSGSDGHSPHYASPHYITEQTPPPWTLSLVQQSNTGPDQSQLSTSCPSPPHNITKQKLGRHRTPTRAASSPVRSVDVLRPKSLFRGRSSGHVTVCPQLNTDQSVAPEHSARRYLLSCLPSCLQVNRT